MNIKDWMSQVEKRNYSKNLIFIFPLVFDPDYYDDNILDSKITYSNELVLFTKKRSQKLENHPKLVKHETGKEEKYFFNIGDEYSSDVIEFIKGKYSKINIETKKKICKFHAIANKTSVNELTVYKILFKTEDRKQYLEDLLAVKLDKDAELLSIPNEEEEMYEE